MHQLTCHPTPQNKAQIEAILSQNGALAITQTGTSLTAIFTEPPKQLTLPIPHTWQELQASDWQYTDARDIAGLQVQCPNTVFGNLDHPTTRLCLQMLETVLVEHPKPETLSVVDIGSGSGILSLVAWTYGVRQIVGLDIDPEATACALGNAKQNQISGIDFITQDLHQWQPESAIDLLIANIPGEHLLPFLSVLSESDKMNGAILSGISTANLALVQPMIESLDFNIEQIELEGWYGWILSKT